MEGRWNGVGWSWRWRGSWDEFIVSLIFVLFVLFVVSVYPFRRRRARLVG